MKDYSGVEEIQEISHEIFCVLESHAMKSSENFLIFYRNLVPPSSGKRSIFQQHFPHKSLYFLYPIVCNDSRIIFNELSV
jgi:hypothetical protein